MKNIIEAPNFQEIDRKQQNKWESEGVFRTPAKPAGKKFYCLDMFPYPSGEGLHVGHPEGYTASDIISRYKRMNGFDVLHPMGWDAFGLPAENFAISSGIHPETTTRQNIKNFRRQIRSLGFSYDWDREINTTFHGYYKWTQWIFLQLFKKGLAYEENIPINWCPSCKTGLANEEVFEGKCERCESPIQKKNLRQWMLKITAYADRLLEDLGGIDWPQSTLLMQKNWIGRSEGVDIDFKICGSNEKITAFTTRPDTLYGATYLVLAPEHPLVEKITAPENKKEIEAYIKEAQSKLDIERLETQKEKTGVFTGACAINPANEAKMPVWIADYVLMTYGTGAIMAVPGHDQRDWEFAKKYDLPVLEVVKPFEGKFPKDRAFMEDGIAVNSGILDGLKTPDAKKKMSEHLVLKNCAVFRVNYKLRDWVFSRQRYWGEPIPVIHCPKCGAAPVPEKDLPVLLPKADKYQPTGTGESPLAAIESWVNVKCPECGGPGKRETNTMPQWAGSCWYYLRFIDPKNPSKMVNGELERLWMPVDLYIGGSEHAVLHLLYARFWHKVLYDLGFVSTKEPFKKLVHQGMILSYAYRDSRGVYRSYEELEIKDNGNAILQSNGEEIKPAVEKMSKSKKNVINPDNILNKYGADAFRMYEMFMGPLEDSKPWDMKGIEGVHRFLKRVWGWGIKAIQEIQVTSHKSQDINREIEILRNETIKKVTEDLEAMKFNTAISALMIYLNKLIEAGRACEDDLTIFLKLLHPFAPHITDELWDMKGGKTSLIKEQWPQTDINILSERKIEIPIQINGKVKARIYVIEKTPRKELEKLALKEIEKFTSGNAVKKIIVVPGRLVSIVTGGDK